MVSRLCARCRLIERTRFGSISALKSNFSELVRGHLFGFVPHKPPGLIFILKFDQGNQPAERKNIYVRPYRTSPDGLSSWTNKRKTAFSQAAPLRFHPKTWLLSHLLRVPYEPL